MNLSIMFKAIPSVGLILICELSAGQSIVGFWGIKEVTVAGKITTPVAKWTRINTNGTFQSGNGWLQNAEGTWKFDKTDNTFLPTENNGIIDPYGAFKVILEGDQMSWVRKEDGDQVIVKLERIEALPKSTADFLVGLWDLKERLRNGESEKSIYDPKDKYYIFIRWDRMYVERTADGSKAYGYWHINGHRPELTLISQKDEKLRETWAVEVDDKTLMMNGISETNKELQLVFERINQFPK